jgi:hypothetical protein
LAEVDQRIFAFCAWYYGFKSLPFSYLQRRWQKSAKISILAPEPPGTPRNPLEVPASTLRYSRLSPRTPRPKVCPKVYQKFAVSLPFSEISAKHWVYSPNPQLVSAFQP